MAGKPDFSRLNEVIARRVQRRTAKLDLKKEVSMENCHECGHELHVSEGPGRQLTYRGEPRDIPSNFKYLACRGCGAEWMTSGQIEALNDIFEKQDP